MKKLMLFGLACILLLPLLIIGCNDEEPTTPVTPTTVPAINGGQEAQIIDLTLDEFTPEKNVVKDIELIRPGSLIVRLASNPTTGYEWGEAEISASSVVVQASRDFVGPEDTGMVGSGGTDVWVFDSKESG
ncbi:MAG: hypothetical protein A2Y90_02225, partial [Chloroflexi bacterium RBG_13_52_12]